VSGRKFLRVELVPAMASHLICVACGNFHCDFAIVADGDKTGDGQAGVHKKCIAKVKAKRGVT
jgi:hypothetical protein